MFDGVFKGKSVLVTGHTGFKGAWLCSWLIELGADVYGVSDQVYDSPSAFEALRLDERMTHVICDIRDAASLASEVEKCQPDFIFHMAAQAIVSVAYDDPIETFNINAIGTANLLNALRDYKKPCTVICITSDKCYENVEWIWGYKESDHLGGKDPYSSSKAAAELVVHCFNKSFFADDHPVRIGSVRAGNVVGGGDWAKDRIVPDAARSWANGDSVTIRRPRATRPWQHVLEPLSGYLRLAQMLSERNVEAGEAFNFGPKASQNVTVAELLDELLKTWKPETTNPIIVDEVEKFKEAGLLKLNCDKALAQLKWLPTLEFEECAEMTATWYKQFYDGGDAAKLTSSQIKQYCDLARSRGAQWA